MAFLLHPLEEAATDFPLWFRTVLGGDLDPVTFALINATGVLVVTGAMLVHRRRGDVLPLVPAAVGTLVLLNATVHAVAALLTLGYVPGVVTSLLVWAPLGVVLLSEAREAGPDVLRRGLAVGVTAQLMVTAVARFL
ncbi:MAG TPA: HXXEE domain-containing protein [Longimicrobiales bacterium]|nr:HXXEE domain-containing protein [Longimicrobiales bacterium]